MELKIRATDQIVRLDGVRARRWTGRSSAGTPCEVLVHRVMVDERLSGEFRQVLDEQLPPATELSIDELQLQLAGPVRLLGQVREVLEEWRAALVAGRTIETLDQLVGLNQILAAIDGTPFPVQDSNPNPEEPSP